MSQSGILNALGPGTGVVSITATAPITANGVSGVSQTGDVTIALTTPLAAQYGGTGVASPTAHTLPVAEGSSAFTFLGPLTNGQLLIGSTGADPVAATLTAGTGVSITNGAGSISIALSGSGTVSSIAGTAHQIAVSAATGAVTVSLTNGISIGSYQAIAPPVGGIIVPGSSGFGTSSVAADYGMLIQYANVIQLGINGTTTSLDTIITVPEAMGIYAGPILSPSGSPGILSGVRTYPSIVVAGGQTATWAAGVTASLTLQSNAGTVTNFAGIYVDALGGLAGTGTNAYGGYFTNPGVGSTKTALYSDNHSVGFAGVTPPTSGIIISGKAAIGVNAPYSTTSALTRLTTRMATGDTFGIVINGTANAVDGNTQLYAEFIFPTLSPTSGAAAAGGMYMAPTISAPSAQTINAAAGIFCVPAWSSNVGTITTAYGIAVDASAGAGTISKAIGLYVNQPTAGSTNVCAAFEGTTVIGGNSPYSSNGVVPGLTMTMKTTYNRECIVNGTANAKATDTTLYVFDIGPTLSPTGGAGVVAGMYMQPVISSPSAQTVSVAAGLISTPFYNSNVGTITDAYSMILDSSGGAGTITRMTNLIVRQPTAGSTNICAAFQGGVCVGSSYATTAPPSNGAIIQGKVGFGTSSPSSSSQITITSAATNTYGIFQNGTMTAAGNHFEYLSQGTLNPSNGLGSAFMLLNGSIIAPSATTMPQAAGFYTYLNWASNVGTISNAISCWLGPGTGGAGTITRAYSLYCDVPVCGSTNICAVFAGGICVGTSYTASAPPSSGMIVEGQVGIGASSVTSNVRTQITAATTDFLGFQVLGTLNGVSSTNQFAMRITSTLQPTSGGGFIEGLNISPTVISPSAQTISSFICTEINPTMSSNVGTITTAYSLYVGSSGTAGTITTMYGLYVATPSAGTTKICAYFDSPIKLNASAAGAGVTALGANCPAGNPSVPYTWLTFISPDGSTTYVPCWK